MFTLGLILCTSVARTEGGGGGSTPPTLAKGAGNKRFKVKAEPEAVRNRFCGQCWQAYLLNSGSLIGNTTGFISGSGAKFQVRQEKVRIRITDLRALNSLVPNLAGAGLVADQEAGQEGHRLPR